MCACGNPNRQEAAHSLAVCVTKGLFDQQDIDSINAMRETEE